LAAASGNAELLDSIASKGGNVDNVNGVCKFCLRDICVDGLSDDCSWVAVLFTSPLIMAM
jgi:hypothetical protein